LPAEALGAKDIGRVASAPAAVKRRVKSQRSVDIRRDSVPNELGEVKSRIFVCRPKVDSLHGWLGWMTFSDPGFKEIMRS
jgi:hypothetical protein